MVQSTSPEKTCSDSEEDPCYMFGTRTTIHGVKYVANPKFHVFRRIVWGLILFISVCCLIFNIANSVQHYLRYPVSTVVGVHYVNELEFPSVTLCNYNQLRKSRIDNDALPLLGAVFGISEGEDLKDLGDNIPQDELDITNLALNATHKMQDMLMKCSWRGNEQCDFNDFRETITDYGVCYTFNHPQNEDKVLKVNQPGKRHGLFLRLDIQQNEYLPLENGLAGFKVVLHPPGVRPFVREYGFSVAPGFETSVSVTTTKMYNLPQPYSNCEDRGKVSNVYTQSACLQECKETYVTNKCKCRDFRYQGDASICDAQRMVECIYPAEASFDTEKSDISCHCPAACKAKVYKAELSQAALMNLTENPTRNNYLNLRVFFEELSYQTVTQVHKYSTADLLMDIGIVMVVFIGMSILSLVEIIDFLIIVCWNKCCK